MTNTAATARLTEGPISRHLVKLTLPMIWGILAIISFNLVDTYFVARLGPRALAALSFTFPVVMTFVSIGIGLAAGTSSVLARAVGAGDLARARRLATDAMTFAFLLVTVMALCGIATIEPLFRILGAEPELLPLVRDYMVIWYLGIVFMIVPMVGTGAMRAMGDSRLAGIVLGGGALLNMVLDPLLIFGLLGLPRLELQGAALASVIARALTFALAVWALWVKYRLLTHPWPGLKRLMESWRAILHVGLPAAGTNAIIPIATGVVVAMLAQFGEATVAGFGPATRVEGLALVVFYALSAIIGPLVGQNLGAGKLDRVREAVRLSTAFAFLFGLAVALVLIVLAGPIAGLFSDAPEIVSVTRLYLLVVPISYGGAGAIMIANAAFNGLGQPGRAVMLSLARMVVLYLPLAYLLGQVFGPLGIFGATALANLSVGIVAYFWIRRFCGPRPIGQATGPNSSPLN